MKATTICAPALLSALMAACSPSATSIGAHELVILLPQAPAAWASLPELRISLSWKGPEGRSRSLLAPFGSRQRIEVERGAPQALIARPYSSGRPLRPAGALYPLALAAAESEKGVDELSLDWRGGYAASIALALEGGGIDPACYDLYRLVDGAIARSGDPWLVSPVEAARRLAALDFRIDLYGEAPRASVVLPGPGPWAPESPFAEEAASTASLPEGLWRYLGASSELLVSVDPDGRAAVLVR
jgi:hypothetical protein